MSCFLFLSLEQETRIDRGQGKHEWESNNYLDMLGSDVTSHGQKTQLFFFYERVIPLLSQKVSFSLLVAGVPGDKHLKKIKPWKVLTLKTSTFVVFLPLLMNIFHWHRVVAWLPLRSARIKLLGTVLLKLTASVFLTITHHSARVVFLIVEGEKRYLSLLPNRQDLTQGQMTRRSDYSEDKGREGRTRAEAPALLVYADHWPT